MAIYTHSKSLSARWEKFLNQVNKNFDYRFDYSKSNYINAHTPITIICPDHGKFDMIPWVHSASTTGCPSCSQNNFTSSKRFDKQAYLLRCEAVHGDKFNYDSAEYYNMKSNIQISCPNHGSYYMNAWQHLQTKHGCPSCANEAIGKELSTTRQEFISRACLVHGDKFDYSKVEMRNNSDRITIICSKHGEFKQVAQSHLGGGGCPKCVNSKGEDTVRIFLEGNDIRYIAQHTFPDCKRTRCLRFDFYCPEYNLCIEYDGEGHFRPIKVKDKDKGQSLLLYAQENDRIKTDYCEKNNIHLLRINYTQRTNIDEILYKELSRLTN